MNGQHELWDETDDAPSNRRTYWRVVGLTTGLSVLVVVLNQHDLGAAVVLAQVVVLAVAMITVFTLVKKTPASDADILKRALLPLLAIPLAWQIAILGTDYWRLTHFENEDAVVFEVENRTAKTITHIALPGHYKIVGSVKGTIEPGGRSEPFRRPARHGMYKEWIVSFGSDLEWLELEDKLDSGKYVASISKSGDGSSIELSVRPTEDQQ